MKENKCQEALNYFLDREEGENITVTIDWLENAEMLQELIDKETQMKVIKLAENKYSCQKCSMAFELKTSRTNMFVNNQYCDVCGQKLDLGEEE